MLNRNRLFGNQNAKLDEKIQRGPGMGAYPGAAAGQRPWQPPETPSTPDPAKAAKTETPAVASPAARGAEEAKGSKLIVGPNIKLKGVEITDCDTLVVEGHVEATMDSRSIQIAEPGTFCGTVGIDIAEIRGKFSGELTARNRLVIHSTGKVSGKIRYGALVIEDGGELSGEITRLASSPHDQGGQTGKAAVKPPVAGHVPSEPVR